MNERNFCERCGKRLGGEGHIHTCTPPAAQPSVPLTDEQIDAKFDAFASKFEHESNEWLDMGADAYFRAGFRAAHDITAAPQPVPVKTYHDGKPWPVAPKPWVGLTNKEWFAICEANNMLMDHDLLKTIEAKLKEKNT